MEFIQKREFAKSTKSVNLFKQKLTFGPNIFVHYSQTSTTPTKGQPDWILYIFVFYIYQYHL